MNEKLNRLITSYNYLRLNGLEKTQKGVASKMKASITAVSRAFNGQEGYLTDSFLQRYNAAYSNIFVLDWLLTGSGSMLSPSATSPPSALATPTASSAPKISYTAGRPYYNVDFIGGFDLVLNDQTINPEYNIDFAPYNQPGVVWCNITGNSMQPKISNGDIIAIKEVINWKDYLTMGETYALITTNNLRTVKIVRKSLNPDHYRLVPINTEEFDEQDIAKEMIARVFSVLGCVKKL